jgi:centromere/kinetochore protein ZW10
VVNKSRYYSSLGQLVDATLERVLADVLELDDITEDESNRLAELCRILNALEGLFVEDAGNDQPSFAVAYVPSWLKFSYLSVLLVRALILMSLPDHVMNAPLIMIIFRKQEASIADIQYLFDDGALVDFEVEELAKLVRALFAETPLRTNIIGRLLHGHPVRE